MTAIGPFAAAVAAPLLDALAALSPCLACGVRPARAYGTCDACRRRIAPARRDGDVVSLGGYRGALGEMIRSAKFGGAMRVLDLLGGALSACVFSALSDHRGTAPIHLIPVPSHPRRRAVRGEDPSARLARAILTARPARQAHDVRATVSEALTRSVSGPPQSTLAASRRTANVAGAFTVDPRWRTRLSGARVVLVDDVLTSGATVRSAAQPLRSVGATIVLVVVVAVARS